MLIDFRELFPRWNIQPKGVLHVGANIGEEAPVYLELGIERQIWIEPNPQMVEKLVANLSNNPKAFIHMVCAGDENKEVVLHISNNAGQSSSVLELGTHRDVHPDVFYVEDITVPMVRLDTFFRETDIQSDKEQYSLEGIDFLNIDTQGFEASVLRGMGELLHNFKWAYLEVNKAELYKQCALVEEIDKYLTDFGFERVETMWAGNTNWGDSLYIKK